jgi:threonine/homoserine/homoserine lactone efflux protein
MFDSTTIITYVMASIAIILAPGPAQALSLANTLSGGKKAGILTVLGLNVSTIIYSLAAALGLSAALATSAFAFAIVKYIGAAYLLYLGAKAVLVRNNQTDLSSILKSKGSSHTFIKAVITGLLNPKVALFFLAFIPQFVNPTRGSVLIQFLVLGSILGILDILYESTLVLITGAITNWLTYNKSFALWRQRVTGAVLIALGVRLLLVQRN